MSVEHRTWSVQRDYPHPVATVFRAWGEPSVKARWFDLSEPGGGYTNDFRIGGTETYRSPTGVTPTYAYDAVYHDLVPDQLIVTAYTVSADGRRMSVSVATVEFAATARGTRLTFTDQGAYLNGLDTPAARQAGTTTQLDALDRVLTDQGDPSWPSS